VTTDAVDGGISVANAMGSALSRQTPSRPRILNLYRVPTPTPGTKISQTPLLPSERMGWVQPAQPSKSPVTRTPCAVGAQTAKLVPVTVPFGVSYACRWAPRASHSRSCRPSPIRCRSTSPSVGSQRYGSSTMWTSSP
jgi:hypothetical protein